MSKMAAPNRPKIMSSRLAGMKFMQRTGGGSSTPNSTPSTPSGPPSKKQRLSNGSAAASPATPADRDASAVQNDSETKWYLNFRAPEPSAVAQSPLRIVSAGYSALDAVPRRGTNEDGDEDEERMEEDVAPRGIPGRKSFGKFNRKIEKAQNPDLSSSSESDSDSADEEDDEDLEADDADDPTGVKALIAQGRKEAADRARAERKAKKKEKQAEMKDMAEQRRKKGVNLNKVTSISGGGGGAAGDRGAANIECYNCHKKGHRKQDCPESNRSARRY